MIVRIIFEEMLMENRVYLKVVSDGDGEGNRLKS